MKNMIRIYCENVGKSIDVEMGTPLLEVLQSLNLDTPYPSLAAYVNNRLKELNYKVYTPISIRFIDSTHYEGYRVYQRSITFIMQAAIRALYPNDKFHVRMDIGQGLYCEIDGHDNISEAECQAIEAKAREIVALDLPIIRSKVPTEEAVKELEREGYDDKIALLKTRPRLYSNIHRMGNTIGCFIGTLAPSTKYIDRFEVHSHYKGFYLALPERTSPNKIMTIPKSEKYFEILHQYSSWVNIMGVPTVGHVNSKVLNGDASEMIKIAEAFHEKQLARIADTIAEANRERGVKMVLISGPSSSGKTTTAKRLGIQLRVLGWEPVLISLDDYFVPRELTPKDENGEYDYEALEAIDLVQLNEHLRRLDAGESVDIPRYDFITGTRQWHESPLTLTPRSILILEGIHGLNPRLTPSIPENMKFRIYVSCFTTVAMDNISRIPATDNRLLRRVVRDAATRGNSAYNTLARWASVRRGEERHIFPYRANADVMFNTSLFYEISVLRTIVEPHLREIPDTVPEYGEAQRMLKFLDNFIPIPSNEIPPTSILREFIGGSSFKY